MLTFRKANQLLEPYHYHILIGLRQRFIDYNDSLVLVKTSNVLHSVANMDLGTNHMAVKDNCGLVITDSIPNKVALVMKHLMESLLKYGVDKVFEHHLTDDMPHDAYIFQGDDNGYYYKHDKYLRKDYKLLINQAKKNDLVDDYQTLVNTLNNINNDSHALHKDFDWKKISKVMVQLAKLTHVHEYRKEIDKRHKRELLG